MTQATFQPKKLDPQGQLVGTYDLTPTKVVCVGRNYADHAKELNNPVPTSPILFIKPTNTLVDLQGDIAIPLAKGECHHELEIALLITSRLCHAGADESLSAIGGVGLALDLTLRDLQAQLKSKAHPWERAKAFDGACPLSGFIETDQLSPIDWNNLTIKMTKNDQVAQQGNSKNMLFPIARLLSEISQNFTLFPGDIVLTGTPEGVAALTPGDRLELFLRDVSMAQAQVVAAV